MIYLLALSLDSQLSINPIIADYLRLMLPSSFLQPHKLDQLKLHVERRCPQSPLLLVQQHRAGQALADLGCSPASTPTVAHDRVAHEI
jgi:hypothetical protein